MVENGNVGDRIYDNGSSFIMIFVIILIGDILIYV